MHIVNAHTLPSLSIIKRRSEDARKREHAKRLCSVKVCCCRFCYSFCVCVCHKTTLLTYGTLSDDNKATKLKGEILI